MLSQDVLVLTTKIIMWNKIERKMNFDLVDLARLGKIGIEDNDKNLKQTLGQ